ncbi:MAG: flagellar hook-length control protein FliK [Marinobacter sp.]|uniref:flagellar hook-length control protein FliK n=1 Tax=Marinobacter sp. TaxID=50741 RepID=UPI00299D4CD4|nr:flagellar hook-length control protein FliK [Marinobacter sp.]MDX1757575.1 flagellar hook-length control protein FliK [Marinobacter sp.]
MTAPLLPPSPAPGKAGQASDSHPSGSSGKSGESRFDEVSHQERRRLERSPDSEPQDKRTQPPEEPGSPPADPVAGTKPGGEGQSPVDAEQAGDGEPAWELELLDQGNPILFSFADLQALAEQPVTGNRLETGLPPGRAGTVAGPVPMLAIQQANGQDGGNALPGQSMGQVVEALLGQPSTEGGRPIDPAATLAAASRGTGTDLAGHLAQTQAQANTRLAEPAVPLRGYTTSIELPVGHAEWGDKLVGKLTWLTANKMSVAEIHLTPPDMGPMEVRVQVQQDQATVTVHSANPVVRDQLELHSHRLREMLNEQGIALDQFDVADSHDHRGGDREGGADDGDTVAGGVIDDDGSGQAITGDALDLSWRGEVDLYA